MDTPAVCAECHKPASDACGNCKSVHYCSRDCQVNHWKTHKEECGKSTQKVIENFQEYIDSFNNVAEVKKVPGKGRGLFATRTFQPGDVIFSERAVLVSDISSENANPLQQLVDLVLQVITSRSKATLEVLLQLNGHESRAAEAVSQSVKNVIETLNSTPDYAGKNLLKPIEETQLKKLAQVFMSNTHGIEDQGVGLFLLSSMMNHECLVENCNFYTEGDTMYILAVRPIESGAELTIDYRWSYSCVAERQENLQESYGFTCTCRSCTVQPDLTRPFACEDGDCPGPVFPIGPGSSWKCSFCSKVPKESRIKQFLAQEAQAKTSVTNSATKKAFFARKDCLLREEHYIFFRAVDEEVAPLASRGIDPLPSIQYLVACIEKLLPENHASRATFYEMLGDAYRIPRRALPEAKRREKQREAYGKALKVREIARGKESADVARMRLKMSQI